MATQKADYYETLGVGRDATPDEIKRAFRRLAMEFHPDRNSDPSAEARFKEINEAYEVLSDADRRGTYDRFGHAGLDGSMGSRGFEGFGPFGGFGDIFDAFFGAASQTRRRAPSRGADLQVAVELSFEEAAFGAQRSVVINRTELCSQCNGLRAEPGTEPQRCPVCEGLGEVRRVQRSVFGQFINVTACDRCRGEGWIIPTPCTKCRGTGRERVTRTLEVKIPAGVDNGSQIRLTGEGELGSYGGPRGSTYVILRVAAHPIFERIEDDLHVRLNINFAQAALGDEIEVPTLEGDQRLKIGAGTESGEVLTLRHKGVAHLRGGGRGDLHVHVQVTTPKKLSGEQKKLLQQLQASLEKDDGGKNLFEKVKDALS
ncbi:MAG TPA: molecular chaperone DnaJ [Dehalococcoidia bacterium]|nr:molecular chaperone DnaJ [Dehalococcoidia bacterium]